MKKVIDVNVVRNLIADYIASEGCPYCEYPDRRAVAEEALAKLLGVPKYSDGSGFDFGKFKSKRESHDK